MAVQAHFKTVSARPACHFLSGGWCYVGLPGRNDAFVIVVARNQLHACREMESDRSPSARLEPSTRRTRFCFSEWCSPQLHTCRLFAGINLSRVALALLQDAIRLPFLKIEITLGSNMNLKLQKISIYQQLASPYVSWWIVDFYRLLSTDTCKHNHFDYREDRRDGLSWLDTYKAELKLSHTNCTIINRKCRLTILSSDLAQQ